MQIFDFDAFVRKPIRKFFCKAFGKSGYEHPLLFCNSLFNFLYKIGELVFAFAYLNCWVQKPGWSDKLFHKRRGNFLFVGAGGCGGKYYLSGFLQEFIKVQRTIVSS